MSDPRTTPRAAWKAFHPIQRVMKGVLGSFKTSSIAVPSWYDGKRSWYGEYIGRFTYAELAAVPSTDLFVGAKALLYSSAISSITPRDMVVRWAPLYNGTLAWVYDNEQTVFGRGAIDSSPIATVTAAAASGTIGTLGTLPANWWIRDGIKLTIDAYLTRGATAAATATMGIAIGGTTIWSVSAVAAATTRVVRIFGEAFAVSGTSQFVSGTLTELTSAAIGASTNPGLTATSDLAITAVFSSATVNDVFELGSFSVTLNG